MIEDLLNTAEDLLNSVDAVCPICCGDCCRYWRDVEELLEKFPQQSIWSNCPNNDEQKGCLLPRNSRPSICNHYLCDKARAIVYPDGHTAKMMQEILDRVSKEPTKEVDKDKEITKKHKK
jgi:hypothetical protein